MNLIMVMVLIMFYGLAHSTPGGLDIAGCHKPASKSAAYHCHPPARPSQLDIMESRESRLKRLQKECADKPKTGQCRGVRK